MATTFEKMGENTQRFIKRQQENAIGNRNQGVPTLKPKIKLLKTSKRKRIPTTLRG